MKILVIQQKMIGDVLASSVICNNLKTLYPESEIDYLIYPFTKPVVENNPNIDHLILFKDEYRESKKAFLKFLISIRKSRYDMVFDAYGKLESNLVVAFSDAKTKIGFHKSYSNFLYTKTIKEIPTPLTNAGTALENRINLVKAVSDQTDFDFRPKIFLTENEIEIGRSILLKHHIDFSKKVFMIGVLGSGKSKTYPLEYMAKVLDNIVQKTNATLLFNYMPSQIEEAKAIFDLCQKETQNHIKIDVVPGSIREFLSITHHCHALIGNEGGAVNMAKALNIPTFTIFSTWIKKEAWNSFEDGTRNVSVHLKDFKPELYGSKSPKEMKKEAMTLYQSFTPDLITPSLENYLKN
ncbi:glycosyltransferase family 9 protein [Flavobacterium tegetincola]|uniref:glycosyltransferase family 9 protein n=1 Tax=Flavobacterium tegetincola TaxID=150172 RepID=UPI00047E1FBD|nr:glycosyltransferase family 9 protein [Flavobacterium tegetincola]